MGDRQQTIQQKQQVLIAAAPDDPLATALVDELRKLNVEAILADTVEVASQADTIGACVVIIRPGGWRTTPAIATAIRCNPRDILALQTEPIPYLSGRWSADPLLVKEPLSTTAHEIATLISQQKQTLPISEPQPRQYVPARQKRPLRSSRTSSILFTIVLLLIIGGLLYFAPHIIKPTTIPAIEASSNKANQSLLSQPYSATVPGKECDSGGANWDVGNRFKAPATPVATTAAQQATATPQVVFDPSVVTTCQKNGLLVTHTDHYDGFASIFFDHNAQALPSHFQTQITATVISGTEDTSFDFGVHHQEATTDDQGYGDDELLVHTNGSWQTERINDTTDAVDTLFTHGFVGPAKTFILSAEINGAQMTFSINGHVISTIVDTTYPKGYSIEFGMSDGEAKSPPRALFSHFIYTPLDALSTDTTAAVATATAQAIHTMQQSYVAAIPGFGCDKGSGQWQPDQPGINFVTTRCLAHGLAISTTSKTYIGTVSFDGLDGNLSANNTVKTQVDISSITVGCAGINISNDQYDAGNAFAICSDGSSQYWQILHTNGHGSDWNSVTTGDLDQSITHELQVTTNGSTQSIIVDGQQVGSIANPKQKTIDHIALFVTPDQSGTETAVFSNFVFTPQN